MKFNGSSIVKSTRTLTEDVFQICVERKKEMGEIAPGQFFNILASDTGFPLLRRPISLSDYTEESLTFTIKNVGVGTNALSKVKVNDTLQLMGPLGNGFECIANGNVLIIGGGIGVAPILGLLKKGFSSDVEVTTVLGFKDKPYLLDAFEALSQSTIVVSETDGNHKIGFVTEPVGQLLEQTRYDMVYVCGPLAMIKAVAKICNEKQQPAQLLMEEKMACGIGACLVCTCKIKEGDFGFTHQRMCKEGPMFYASEVIFDGE